MMMIMMTVMMLMIMMTVMMLMMMMTLIMLMMMMTLTDISDWHGCSTCRFRSYSTLAIPVGVTNGQKLSTLHFVDWRRLGI